MKKLFVLFSIVSLFVACTPKEEKAVDVATVEFDTQAPEMLGQLITIEGTVNHVCKHGGKKMFIGGENVKIVASEKIAVFDPVLEGSDVVVTGYIREEMTEPVLAEETLGEHSNMESAENTEMEGSDSTAVEGAEAEACDMENMKPLYVIEVKEVKEKAATTEEK